MLTAESLIAKVVTVIVEKTVGKIVGLATDKRKKACRALTKLYYSVQSLDDATERFIETFSSFRRTSDAEALISALLSQSRLIELASNDFIELSQELEPGIEIIDPALARCCQILYHGKGDFLSFMSQSIELKFEGGKRQVVMHRPNKRILGADFDQAYLDSQLAHSRGERYYWPSGAFDYFEDFEEVTIHVEDEVLATELIQMIREQNKLLKVAKEALRKLIKESFSIEEILFQSDSRPH